jgi:type I restriction enzyme, S subunit
MADLKPGWKRVRFSEIAECINDRVGDPSKAGVDRYVGLDHLDSDSLKIRRWGAPEDVESTKLRFRSGDVIFGKRRAYQRKLAVADFEGICSAHAMVLRAKSNAVIAEFLPYFMQSDVFMERAIAISVGSLSPTINWKTLASEDFVLPPLDEQARAVRVLSRAQSLVEATAVLGSTARVTSRAWLKGTIGDLIATAGGSVELGQLLEDSPDSGCSAPERDEETGHWVLALSALEASGYVPGQYKSVDPTRAMLCARLSEGDLLISRSNTRERVGFVGRFVGDGRDVSFPDTMMRLRYGQSASVYRRNG